MWKVKGPRIRVLQDKLEDNDPVFAAAKKAGLAISDSSREKKLEQNAIDKGTIVDVGQGCWQPPIGDGTPWCKIGDKVIFAKYAGSIRKEGEDIYILLNDEDILEVWEEDNG